MKHTQETKDLLSAKRKAYLAANPDKHPWRANKVRDRRSRPCDLVKDFLRKRGMSFVEEWMPLEDRNFSIDIAFPDIKVGIEVNGNQHYNRDGSLRPYYEERHRLITEAGWRLIEIHYSLCFNEEVLTKVIDVQHTTDYTDFILTHLDRQARKKTGTNRRARGELLKQKKAEQWAPFILLVQEANIDFSKFGWVKAVSEIIKISPQKTGAWMKLRMPDVYAVAFKREAPGVCSSVGRAARS